MAPRDPRDDRKAMHMGGVNLLAVAAQFGTPTYVYDLDGMTQTLRSFYDAFGTIRHLVAYAVKSNESGPILRALHRAGAGADVVSGLELTLALACGIPPNDIVFSGVAKRDDEIAAALLAGDHGVRGLHLESIEEIDRVQTIAARVGCLARVSLRVNPGGESERLGTHSHIATGHDGAKFGIGLRDVRDAIRLVSEHKELRLVGLSSHIGSQLETVDEYAAAATSLFSLAADVRASGRGTTLEYLDTGGGFGVDYTGTSKQTPPANFIRAAATEWRKHDFGGLDWVVEPGRVLTAKHGVLVSKVIQTKRTDGTPWLFIDAGMNDLIRPALYGARHRVVAVEPTADGGATEYRVAGPVCESSDDFGLHRVEPCEYVALLDCGAYGASMASRYNARMAPTEVFVRDAEIVHVTKRGSPEEWLARQLG